MEAPAYVTEPIKRFTEYADSATKFFKVSMRAIEATQSLPRIFRAIASIRKMRTPEWDDSDHTRQLEQADDDAEFAAKECADGFPLLQEFTLVGLWGAFEAAVEDLVIGVISNEPDFLRAEPFARVKIPLADFEVLSKDDRMRILLRELQRVLRSDQRQGVNGFEAILDSVGLSSQVPEEIREALWEMHHLRNLIVHRGGIVDRTFADACPKLGLKVGAKVKLSRAQITNYVLALLDYCMLIGERLSSRYGFVEGLKD